MKIDHTDALEQQLAAFELATSRAEKRACAEAIDVGLLVQRFRELQNNHHEAEVDRDRWMRIAGEHTFERVSEELQRTYRLTQDGIEVLDPAATNQGWLKRREERQRRLAALKPFSEAAHQAGCGVLTGGPCTCGAWESDRQQLEERLRELAAIEKEFG